MDYHSSRHFWISNSYLSKFLFRFFTQNSSLHWQKNCFFREKLFSDGQTKVNLLSCQINFLFRFLSKQTQTLKPVNLYTCFCSLKQDGRRHRLWFSKECCHEHIHNPEDRKHNDMHTMGCLNILLSFEKNVILLGAAEQCLYLVGSDTRFISLASYYLSDSKCGSKTHVMLNYQ